MSSQMGAIYAAIVRAKLQNQKLLAILIDPDKTDVLQVEKIAIKINSSPVNYIFLGGSSIQNDVIDDLIDELKKFCRLPIVLFPGNPSQISGKADGILFLSLISGRNPEFLIENQVKAVPILKKTNLETIPTGYILVKTGRKTAVEQVSQTTAIPEENFNLIADTAQAGELLGHQLIYLEAGSGADKAIAQDIISLVAKNIEIPLIVGGGIKSVNEIKKVFDAGADLVVIGTAFENNIDFFSEYMLQ
jgi:phosphoglycerol geranylgeranyltransferase